MSNDYQYRVCLSIVHPTIDPSLITQTIEHLRPRISIQAGSLRIDKDGKPFTPNRFAELSHWLANLHDGTVYSGDILLCDFIRNRLIELAKHRSFFAHLSEEGQVAFKCDCFNEENCSSTVLSAKTFKLCGELEIDLELNIYNYVPT